MYLVNRLGIITICIFSVQYYVVEFEHFELWVRVRVAISKKKLEELTTYGNDVVVQGI